MSQPNRNYDAAKFLERLVGSERRAAIRLHWRMTPYRVPQIIRRYLERPYPTNRRQNRSLIVQQPFSTNKQLVAERVFAEFDVKFADRTGRGELPLLRMSWIAARGSHVTFSESLAYVGSLQIVLKRDSNRYLHRRMVGVLGTCHTRNADLRRNGLTEGQTDRNGAENLDSIHCLCR